MQRTTQRERVLMYLKEFGSITPLQALKEFGIMRLAARIWELRKRGYNISKTTGIAKNRFGEEVKFARYRLE